MRNQGLSFRQISNATGIPKSTIGDIVKRNNMYEKPIATGTIYTHHDNNKQLSAKRLILTSAQNNTFVHSKFLQSLENMADHIGAEIIVGTFSYNKNGFQKLEKSDGDWFDLAITKYIKDEPIKLADDLVWCGELNILPTAVNPLSGLYSYTKDCSGIVPHAKVQLESLPRHKMNKPRFLYTTGAVTQRNYIQKKEGQKAAFHHIFGTLLVEIDNDGDWFVRQLVAESETGEFYDLTTKYTPNGFVENCRVEAIVWEIYILLA